MTKLEKLRDNLEVFILKLKESWTAFDEIKQNAKPTEDALEKADYILKIVSKLVILANNASDTLNAFSVYTAALENKLIVSKKTDYKRKGKVKN